MSNPGWCRRVVEGEPPRVDEDARCVRSLGGEKYEIGEWLDEEGRGAGGVAEK